METEPILDLDIFADEDHRMVMQSPTTDVDKSDLMEPITPFDPIKEKLNDENELELLKSQDSVLWGEEESDDEDYLTNNSYLTAGDILSQRAALDVPSLTTDDMKNIFGSPQSVKSSRSKEAGYGTDSEQSASSSSDVEGDADDESDKEDKKKASKKGKKEKEPLPNRKSAVQAEIDAVKKLESGPTEAELRRRRLIEIDQDEMEDRIERINRVALKAISSVTGWTAEESLKQLRECREYLIKHIHLPEFEEIVEESIDKHNARVYAVEGSPSVDAIAYLKNDKGDWSDVEEEEKKKAAVAASAATPAAEQEGMIALSDSDNSDSDNDDVIKPAPVVAPVIVKVETTSTTSVSAATSAGVSDMERRKALYMAALNRPKSSRAMLLTTLRQKVHETARENYCHQKKIHVDQLAVRLEIFEKSRILVELLKERHESRTLVERESRRQRYLNLNNDDEDEFDEDDPEFEEGQFLTVAEKEELMLQLSREQAEESEEEENTDDIILSDDEDGDDKMAVVDEELAAAEEMGDVRRNSSRRTTTTDSGDSAAPGENDSGAAATGSDDDEEEVRFSRKSSTRQISAVDTEVDTQLIDEDEIRPVVTYGRRASSVATAAASAGGDGAKVDEVMVDSDNEEEAPVAAEPVKKPKQKSSNALFRLQLEEEARRHRNAKKNGLVDDEAEEEEEEGHQAGLGDFGFGVMSKNKENDEEREALKLRKGDLDHIVDDLSDDEGDDEAAVRARVDMEIREDRERTKQVISAVTEGHDGTRSRRNKGKYSFDRLVADKKKERPVGGDEGAGEEQEEELDEEEMLQRGLKEKYERDRASRAARQQHSYDTDSDSEEEGGDSETEDNIHAIMASETLTEEEKRSEIEKINQLKETERMEALRRKQMEGYTKMRREMRRRMHNNSASAALSGGNDVKTSALTFEPLEPAATNVVIKRRTIQAPKHLTVNHGHPVATATATAARGAVVPPRPGSALPRSVTLGAGVPKPVVRAPSSTLYKGELNQNEVLAGYGMGMAVTSGARKGEAAEGFSGLFSTVTGVKRGASDSIALPSSLKRSFSSSVSKRSGTLTSTVASHQFVFTGANNSTLGGLNETSTLMMDGDTRGFSNAGGGSKLGPSHSLGGGFGGGPSSSGAAGGESSLFAKLGSKASLFKNKK